MSFYSDASLVLIPSGYKDQKVYSAVPTDGSGDLSFSRASSATRVASNGLIEKVRTNEILYSQDFSNAEWSAAAGITLTHGQTDPNGGTTATKVEFSASGQAFEQEIGGLSTSTLYSFSIWVRCDSGTVSFEMGNLNATAFQTRTATTTWQRFSITQTPSATTRYPRFVQGTAASTLYIAFAQLEVSDFGATDYIATTTTAVSVGPVSGLPRLDYLGSTCPRLLLEPQRSNLQTWSEQHDNAAWAKLNLTIIANQATSPSGYQDADLAHPSTGVTNDQNYNSQTKFGLTIGASYTQSVFLKSAGFTWAVVDNMDGGSGAWFNLVTGTVGTVTAGSTAKIENYGNGWYRCSVTSAPSGTTGYGDYRLASANGNDNVTASGTSGIYAWGFQLEAGAYATSYIPTLGTSVTRVADAASKTGISSLIGQTEGTIFFEVDKTTRTDNDYRIQISDGTTNNWLFISLEVGNAPRLYCNVGGVNQFSVYGSVVTSGRHKVAMAYKANDFKVYIDGVAAITQTSGSVPTCSRLDIGSPAPGTEVSTDSKTAQALLFKTRLTNQQLQELTSL
jgi:hypothetical protein